MKIEARDAAAAMTAAGVGSSSSWKLLFFQDDYTKMWPDINDYDDVFLMYGGEGAAVE